MITTVKEVCDWLAGRMPSEPLVFETGSSYHVPEENLIHTTTNNLYYVVASNGGVMFSFDIDQSHIDIAKTIVGPFCFFQLGDSVVKMEEICSDLDEGETIDLACFDSKEFDPDHMVNEYEAVKDRLAEKHYILVDDIHNPNSVKWVKMVPLLKELGYQCVEIPTPTGMLVAAKGYDLSGLTGEE